ncbi:MAG TPA: DNA repair exonuclease [Pirellulales bacterium]|jgi:exonuclease SbcD|nr:DNA repair exonuclease [Pirellulales bacterium]
MSDSLRFLHAADLHLELPPGGVAEMTDHLRSILVEAPLRAAQRVFEAAIKERVDFVVLAGDVIDPLASGPRGLVFLERQFERLASAGILVYWAGSALDDFERWQDAWNPGRNVIRFPAGRAASQVHRRGDQVLAQLAGVSYSTIHKSEIDQLQPARPDLFAIAVVHGSLGPELPVNRGFDYWALGGEHERANLLSGPVTAHYAGTNQGRHSGEPGSRGCTLVEVDDERQIRSRFIPTEAVRYERQKVTIDATFSEERFGTLLRERATELASDPFGADLIVDWIIAGEGPLVQRLRRGQLATDWVARLRAEFGAAKPCVWTSSLLADSHAAGGADYLDEDTVLGEFLRTVSHYREDAAADIHLESYLAERHLAGTLGAKAMRIDPARRSRLLGDVAELGTRLLGPQEWQP